MNGDISFNNNDLQTFSPLTNVGIITNFINHTDMPTKLADMYVIADSNASVIPGVSYPNKKISIGGVIKGSSQADLDSRIDEFKAYFNGKDKNLDIEYICSARRYIATANVVNVVRQQASLFATFAIEFNCTNPFGMDTVATPIMSETGFTDSVHTITPTIGGSAPYQLPVFTITLNSLTGDGDYLQISNDNNNQKIELYGLGLTNGDVVKIDCSNRTVKVNNIDVDYDGTFLELELGPNSITYSDGFTTSNKDLDGYYYKRYL